MLVFFGNSENVDPPVVAQVAVQQLWLPGSVTREYNGAFPSQ